MRLRRVVLIALLLPVLAACTDSAGAAASPVGAWGDPTDPTDPSRPSLVLAEDGRLSGTDGCNRLTGSWTVDGTTLTFSALASTMMFCEGVDTWLLGAAAADLVAGSLVIRDSSGTVLGTLERSEE